MPANDLNIWETVGGVWEVRGLQKDPYFIQPLTEQALPLFRGQSRLETARRVVAYVNAGGSPLILVAGEPGLGKTSLINYALSELKRGDAFFVCPYFIEVSSTSTRETIAAEILAAITTTAVSTDQNFDWEKDERWKEAKALVADGWRSSGFGGGINFAGFGATLSRTQMLQLARVIPWETWKSLIRNILSAMRKRRQGFVLHYNIDAVSDEHPKHIQQLFDELRELFIEPSMYTIIGASPDFENEVLGDRRRLLDVITSLGPLNELSNAEFLQAVEARYDRYRIEDQKFIPPVSERALAHLYNDFHGDMRNTFSLAKTAVINASIASSDPHTLETDEVLALTSPQLKVSRDLLPNVERSIVDFLLERETSPSQREIREATGLSQPGISHATRRLEHKRWITTTKSGTRLAYRLSGYGLLIKRARAQRLV